MSEVRIWFFPIIRYTMVYCNITPSGFGFFNYLVFRETWSHLFLFLICLPNLSVSPERRSLQDGSIWLEVHQLIETTVCCFPLSSHTSGCNSVKVKASHSRKPQDFTKSCVLRWAIRLKVEASTWLIIAHSLPSFSLPWGRQPTQDAVSASASCTVISESMLFLPLHWRLSFTVHYSIFTNTSRITRNKMSPSVRKRYQMRLYSTV